MPIISFEPELDLIIGALRQYPDEQITGALLGTLIKNSATSLNIRDVVNIPIGAGALTKFIHLYLSDYLAQTGKKGGDVVYTIHRDASPSTSIANTNPTNLWSVFIDPLAKNSIYLDLSEKTLSVHSSDIDLQKQDQVKIENLTQVELQSIQTKYMDLISSGKEDQPLVIKLQNATSNAEWFNILRLSHSTEYYSWLGFRRRCIEEFFANRLRKFIEDEDVVKQQVNILMSTQLRAAEALRKSHRSNTSPNIRTEIASVDNTEEHQFRQGLIAAVAAMSIEELRQLSLPYGAVFDSLTKLRR